MKAPKYYGVYAKNGLMVATYWSKVLNERSFCTSEHCKKFDTWEDAFFYAVSGFNFLHPQTPYYGVIDRTNWWYNTKELFTSVKPITMIKFLQ